MIVNLNEIRKLIDDEYYRAVSNHGDFPSVEYGIAPLLEELEETSEELDSIKTIYNGLWESYKCDDYEDIASYASLLYERSQNLIAEACQLGAMAKKMMVVAKTQIARDRENSIDI